MSDLDDLRRDLLAAMDPYQHQPLGYLTVQNTVDMLGMSQPSQSYPAPEVAIVILAYLDRMERLPLFLEAARMAALLCHPNGLDQVRAQVDAASPPLEVVAPAEPLSQPVW